MGLLERFRRPKVGKMQAAGDVEGLIQALWYDQDLAIPDQAQRVLVEIGADAVQPLIDLLADREKPDGARRRAVRILGEIGDPRAQWPVTGLLLEDDWAMREAAARALGTLGNEFSVESLLQTLEHRRCFTQEAMEELENGEAFTADLATSALAVQEGNVQIAVVETLTRIGDAKAASTLRSLREALRAFSRIAAASGPSDSPFAESVEKTRRRLTEAVDHALARLEPTDSTMTD